MTSAAHPPPELDAALSSGQGVHIVLPTYNERDNLPGLVDAVFAALPAVRILVVDDSSPDGTGELADELASRDPRLSVLHRPGKQGLGAAYRDGFRHVLETPGCNVVVQMDCDFSHEPAALARLLAAIEHGADLAIGSRYVPGGSTPGWSFSRRIVSRGGSIFARSVLWMSVHDLTGGFKAWRRDLLAAVVRDAAYAQGYGFQVEMTWLAHRRGASIAEVPITFRDRLAGESKMSKAIIAEAFWMVLRLRWSRYQPAPANAPSPAGDAGLS